MLRRAMYFAVFFPVFVLALLGGGLAVAQPPASDQGAYCAYLTEQAKAQSDLLRTPNAVGAFTQPDTGLRTQLVGGLMLRAFSLLLWSGKICTVQLFLMKSCAEIRWSLYTKSENALVFPA